MTKKNRTSQSRVYKITWTASATFLCSQISQTGYARLASPQMRTDEEKKVRRRIGPSQDLIGPNQDSALNINNPAKLMYEARVIV